MAEVKTGDVGLGPVRRISLSDEIADRLISRILEGKLRFGEKLPPERDLAQLLEVGRPTVREAMKTLSVIGLVEIRPGEGTFVVDKHADFVAKAFSWTILLDRGTAAELNDVRIAIECQQARLAAQRATDEDLDRLQQALRATETSLDDVAAFTDADLKFHLAISHIAGNVALERLLISTRYLLRKWTDLYSKTVPRQAVMHHRNIFKAIAAHDEDAADAAMREHVSDIARWILEQSMKENKRPRRASKGRDHGAP